MPPRRNPRRPRRSIPKEINCEQQELLNNVYACSSFKKPVRRKPGRPRRSIPKEINCQGELLTAKPTEAQALNDCSSLKLKDKFVRRRPGRPRRLVLKEMEGQDSSFKQERDMLVFGRKSTGTGEENCNKKGKYAQVNHNVWDREVNHPIWRGSISIPGENIGVVDGLEAYISSRAGLQVVDAVQRLPVLLNAQLLSRLDLWPTGFHDFPQTDDFIDFYIVPANERSQDAFDRLFDAITREDAVLKAVYADVSIFIFSSLQLSYPNWTAMFGKYYLWAVFEGKNSFFPHFQEANFSKVNFGCHIPILYLTYEKQPVPENEGASGQLNPKNIACFQKHGQSAGVEVESESIIDPSVLEMAKTFDEEACPPEEISSAYNIIEPKYARTLSAILDKHGDITQNCVIKCPKLVACALERVCASVEDLQNIRFVDLRRNHLDFMHSVISDAEVMQIDVKWLRNKYEELVEAIEKLKQRENLEEQRKEVEERVAVKEQMITWKEDRMVKLQGEIEKLKSEIAQATQEKESLSIEIRNTTSKCNYLSQNSLVEGLV